MVLNYCYYLVLVSIQYQMYYYNFYSRNHLYYFKYPTHSKEIIMKKLVIASLTAMFVLTGCNTFKGFGQDVSSAGDAVTGSAQEVQNKI